MVKKEPIKLSEFNIGSIRHDQIVQIKTRLILLNTKPGMPSEYIVTAFPENAKERPSGDSYTISTWPEVVIGIIVETHGDGNQTNGTEKSWHLHPTLRSGRGWRKKKVMLVRGRNYAARLLLGWTASENEKRGL